MWVPYNFQNVYLSCNSLYIINVFDFVFLQNFDCDFLICVNMHALLDFTKSTLS